MCLYGVRGRRKVITACFISGVRIRGTGLSRLCQSRIGLLNVNKTLKSCDLTESEILFGFSFRLTKMYRMEACRDLTPAAILSYLNMAVSFSLKP